MKLLYENGGETKWNREIERDNENFMLAFQDSKYIWNAERLGRDEK